jgi:DNA ligase-1
MNAFEILMNRAKKKSLFNGVPTIAKSYDITQNVVGWCYSEKLDGIRAIWDGRNLRSRNNNIIYCPSSWISTLPPDITLDGELYIGRLEFNKTLSTVRKQLPNTQEWSHVMYHVFDSPTAIGDYTQRMNCVITHCVNIPIIKIVEQFPLGYMNINDLLYYVESIGGEGIMCRNPNAMYIQGPTNELLKVKSFEDHRATVVDIIRPNKRYDTYKLKCITDDHGVVFCIDSGFLDLEYVSAVGTAISFKCTSFTSDNIPVSPEFIDELFE